MNRDEKSAAIEEIAAQIEGAEAIFAVDYRGISVAQAAELRGKLRESDASFRIVKNRLTKLAADKAGEERLAELLRARPRSPSSRGDTAQRREGDLDLQQRARRPHLQGRLHGRTRLDEDKFKSIARLPSREVLDGQLAGVVASPLTGLVRGLGSMIQGLALQLGQIAEKGLVSGEAPAARRRGRGRRRPRRRGESRRAEARGEETAEGEETPADEGPRPQRRRGDETIQSLRETEQRGRGVMATKQFQPRTGSRS